jgi:clavulanate-9-aldehyde reductase
MSAEQVDERLQRAVALVTGASSGIGDATARLLAARGIKVAAVARRRERLERLARSAPEGRILFEAADVSTEEGAARAVAFALRRFGRLDIVVNNAGVMLLGPIEGAALDDWRRMVELNLLGLMYVTQAALPHLIAARGDVVNVSSVAGRVARLGAGAYDATKFGVGAFSEALRQEMSPKGVRVTLVEPGMVETELVGHITHPATRRAMEDRIRSMRPLKPEDVATAILFAVSQPPHASVNEILLRPTDQAYP